MAEASLSRSQHGTNVIADMGHPVTARNSSYSPTPGRQGGGGRVDGWPKVGGQRGGGGGAGGTQKACCAHNITCPPIVEG